MREADFDLVIIGGGPAGLTAAQYGARANMKVLLIEELAHGGQALLIDALENYPGNVGQADGQGNVVSPPKTGYEFSQDMFRQAKEFGAEFLSGSVLSLRKEDGIFIAGIGNGNEVSAYAVIVATGAKHRLLGVPGEKEFSGRGVSYCATCDGPFFRNKKIVVVGGGDAACDEARYLSRLTKDVLLIHRRDRFRAQKALAERVLSNPNIEVRFNTTLKEIKGSGSPVPKVSSVLLECSAPGAREYECEASAVFIFAGMVPQSSLASGVNASLDESGYIVTDQKMAASEPGLFAAGDVRSGSFRQVVVAAGEGATAAHSAAEYVDMLHNRAYV
jgi:thioredoxin reductase (NADPH)